MCKLSIQLVLFYKINILFSHFSIIIDQHSFFCSVEYSTIQSDDRNYFDFRNNLLVFIFTATNNVCSDDL